MVNTRLENWQKIAMFFAPLVHFLFGGWTLPLKILTTFFVLDFISGILAAIVQKELNSSIGALGIAKKIGILILVAVAHLLDQLFTAEAPMLRTVVLYGFISTEGISIVENVSLIGIRVPKSLRAALTQVREREEKKVGGTTDV